MKNLFLLSILFLLLACKKNGCTDVLASNYDHKANRNDGSCIGPCMGCKYQGGIVFYLDGNGGGLIAALVDQSNSAPWGCDGVNILGANATSIGSGNLNTTNIEIDCETNGTAADICANLYLSGYNDWYLPSKDELDLMYQNLKRGSSLNNLGGFSNADYWSSTQGNQSIAWKQGFYGGYQSYGSKSILAAVRAIRKF